MGYSWVQLALKFTLRVNSVAPFLVPVSRFERGQGGSPCNGLYGEAPPKRSNFFKLKHGAILYNEAEVLSLSITNPNGWPMLPLDWLIPSGLILASCHRILFLCNLVPRVSLLCLPWSFLPTTKGGREERPWERGWFLCRFSAVEK